jgi:hypothetical protein
MCWTFHLGVVSLLVGGGEGSTMNDLTRAIPRHVLNWQANEKDEFFNRKTIFEHINGGAELYLAYDFRAALVRRYEGPGDNQIALDVYDMGSSQEAFGIFTSELEGEAVGIGQGSEYCH